VWVIGFNPNVPHDSVNLICDGDASGMDAVVPAPRWQLIPLAVFGGSARSEAGFESLMVDAAGAAKARSTRRGKFSGGAVSR